MAAQPVRLIVEFQSKPEHVQDFVELFKTTFIPRSRLDKGCLLYHMWQNPEEPTQFCMVESWESQADVEAHLAQDWMKELLPKAIGMTTGGPKFRYMRSVED